MQAPFYLEKINNNPRFYADFIGRVPGVPVDTDREATVERLSPAHRQFVEEAGYTWQDLHRAEQIHGGDIAVITKENQGDAGQTWQGVDGLITAEEDILLGIYVADCGAVYLSDSVKGVVALLHSGKKGTEVNITGRAIAIMVEQFGSNPADIVAALAPCIRPPAYEVDFADTIKNQLLTAGVEQGNFTDSDVCTSLDTEHSYSYRMEKGATGRMLALLGMRGDSQ